MKLNINEKKALYTFGCPNHRATVDRLQMLAAITPDPVAGELFKLFAKKIYGCMCRIPRRFHFQWTHLVASAQQKIYFVIMIRCLRCKCIIE